jgi:hypothetical protein
MIELLEYNQTIGNITAISILIEHLTRRTGVNWLQVPNVKVESHGIVAMLG